MTLLKGWDVIFTEVNERETVQCPICYEEMDVQRNVEGQPSLAQAMMKRVSSHDIFTCKHAEKDWHIQVKKLKIAKLETPSGSLAKIYSDEISEIMCSKRCTK